jgi:uncharacterized protein with von Willebrand factor type A (vWA) domain
MSQLANRDYTLIIDKSGSMSTPDQRGGRSRWKAAQESAMALAAKCETFDPDGITLYLFSGRCKRFDNVSSAKVPQIFQENEPSGSTDLAGVLQHATDSYFQRKSVGKARPEMILVVTDGEPDDQRAVMKVIVEASRKMLRDEELAISLIQIGKDDGAKRFLQALDNDLSKAGAKFDICDTVTEDDMEEMSLSEVLLQAIND